MSGSTLSTFILTSLIIEFEFSATSVLNIVYKINSLTFSIENLESWIAFFTNTLSFIKLLTLCLNLAANSFLIKVRILSTLGTDSFNPSFTEEIVRDSF